jgi:hypothetical protein
MSDRELLTILLAMARSIEGLTGHRDHGHIGHAHTYKIIRPVILELEERIKRLPEDPTLLKSKED